MATTKDVQEIISKLSSQKAKARDEGIKLLNSWLEGERSISFCRLLGQNTVRIKPNEIPHAETWPFLITLLTKCIALEISASKKRPPKLILAKTLRTAIQCAEDQKLSGQKLLLFSVVKLLFNHIWDVIKDASSFQSEYSSILRHLLTVKDYRYQMRKPVYCSLVGLYINKVELSIDMKSNSHSSSKEEAFRYILSLHALLENPPGDFPDDIREDLVKGFIRIFSQIRDEGKFSRKLMECINTYLLKDGPNLGYQAMEIHSAVQQFMFRHWLTTHDRGLKNSFVLYARVQLKLSRTMSERSPLMEQLLDVIIKELDQSTNTGTGFLWSDMSRDDKVGTLGGTQQGLMELAATVFYQACKKTTKTSYQEKRLKMEHPASRIKDGIMKGLWLWNGAFSFLIHNYGIRVDKSLLIYWFEAMRESLRRILDSSSALHSYDSLLWLLRALQELFYVLPLCPLKKPSHCSSFTSNETLLLRVGWQDVWSCLLHGLPIFSNVTPIVDVALTLLSNMVLQDRISVAVVPQDIWDLRIFKNMPSSSALYFIACYFSRSGVQGELRDALYLRKSLLRSVLESINFKEPTFFTEQTVLLIMEAIFSLSIGSSTLLPYAGAIFVSSEPNEESKKPSLTEEGDHGIVDEVLDCSVESLAELEAENSSEVKTEHHHSIRLPRQIRQPLIHEMEEYITGFVTSNVEFDKKPLSDLIYSCSLLCNCIYASALKRQRGEKSLFFNKIFDYISKVLDHTVWMIEDKCNEIQHHGYANICSILGAYGSTLSSFHSLNSSPLFTFWKDNSNIDCEPLVGIIKSIEKLLVVLAELFALLSNITSNPEIQIDLPTITGSSSPQESTSMVRIVDIDLDANNACKDVDALTASGSRSSVISSSPFQWKLELVKVISTFFSISPLHTWEVLFELMEKENDAKVHEEIQYILCKKFSGPAGNLSSLVGSIDTTMRNCASLKLCCHDILPAICALLGSLLTVGSNQKNGNPKQCKGEMLSEEILNALCDMVNTVAEIGLPDWFVRVQLIDCICCFVLLEPHSAQVMIEKLLAMLQDTDYRVRLFLARKVGVLFLTWDGHNELFHDICLNFGFEMVMASKGKLVKAAEVSASGAQPVLAMETALITLAHLALCSEEVEAEAVFMICVVAATEPGQRELAFALFDTLSRKLQYASRSKYLEQLMGSILARWVACEVSLMALVEVQDLFLCKSDVRCFVQYCCPWLLAPLILREDITNLNWVSKVSCQPLPDIVKEYFVPIFAVCMAVHCSGKPDKELGRMALCKSVLHLAKISELERDDLIKKHMVSIVSCLLSLTCSFTVPDMPLFTKETVVLSVQTVVDGFLETDQRPTNIGIIDKINIFRPDRVFKFLVEIHYQIAAAVHPRHKCHRLSSIEVLIHIIGHRAAVSSTSCYIFNIVGQDIGNQPLQKQCCAILSTLLEAFKVDPSKEVVSVLGEQLQFLVSKLVACCIPAENKREPSCVHSSGLLSLLNQLTVDADLSLYDYIRELEPFPDLDCLERIRVFHDGLCNVYSPRDQFLKFVRRACYLPQGLLMCSLRHLHKKLVLGEIIQKETNVPDESGKSNCRNCDPDVVSAVWTLVGLCGSNEANNMSVLVADFISRIGIGDPYRVVFHLPKDSCRNLSFKSSSWESSFCTSIVVSDGLLIDLLRLLKKYLLDDHVKIVDMTSRTLRGILSTEKGQGVLLSLDSYESSLIAVHSKGVNLDLVDKLLLDSENYSGEAISLEDPSLWQTEGKTYEQWICSLVHSLISHCDDIILRLCQNIVLLKAEIAELLLANVLLSIAGKVDLSSDLCQLISAKVQENIFDESNGLVKSIQVFLDALNELRSCFVAEKANSFSTPVKHGRPSSFGRTRNTFEKSKDCPSNILTLHSSWKKVYWLALDYLVVAKAAIHCGSYFTAVMYAEYWCEEHFNCLALGSPDFSHLELLPSHIELLVAAFTQINEPDSIYGILQSNKLTSQIITFEHEGNWNKALEYYDLLVRSSEMGRIDCLSGKPSVDDSCNSSLGDGNMGDWKYYKGLMRSLQKTGCTHVLDVYCQGLTNRRGCFQHDSEFTDLQYEAAWRAGNWDFSLITPNSKTHSTPYMSGQFNENLHSCLRALQEGSGDEFHMKLRDSKKELVLSMSNASMESTEYIHSTIVKLQILDHLGMAWDLRWKPCCPERKGSFFELNNIIPGPVVPTRVQLEWLNADWNFILKQAQLHLNLLEPFIAFRRVLLQILDCRDCTAEHLLQSAFTLRKGSRFSLAAAALHELKLLCRQTEEQTTSHAYFLGRVEEAKLLRAQGQHEMAINLARYILQNYSQGEEISNVYRLVGKWLAETRSSNSRTILEQYLKQSVELTKASKSTDKKSISRQCQTYFDLAHYTDGLFKSYEERLSSSEWQAAMRLRKHKTRELDALIRRLKSSSKGEKTDYSVKIQELQKQLTMDREEAEKLQDDRDNFLSLALEGYQHCLVIGSKYDLRAVFRLVSLWFSLYSRQNVVKSMNSTVKEVQSYKFVPLVYQIASRLGSSKDGQGSTSFQIALASLVRKMAIDHPYHTMFQLLALANGDRVKDKQRSRNSFVVDLDKKLAAEKLLNELSSYHGALIQQMKQLVEIYIKLAELETRKEETNKRIPVPREIRSLRRLELVPVVTATVPIDPSCQYGQGSFPHFKGLSDSIMVMNGINAPKVVDCFGSDGHKYRQLAKSGNDDLRQDAVMEQFFGLVNTFLQNQRDTWKRRLRIRTYKVVPFTPSAGVVEWVDRTVPLGEYLLGSTRNGGAHGRYGIGDWSFLRCREHMTGKDKRKAFLKVCDNFRPVMHYFFLERFMQPADWFVRRLSYTRSVAASSMVGYIVGLGDRHSMNILIDEDTTEVVHIDLGVAFEQGLMLKTPERVPFRLTREIVDGMGVTGVEGVFRRCCEETLSVMRTNKEALLTIIEVFIHDPLYKWALSPLKALQRQKEIDDDVDSCLESSQDAYEGNKDAARATLRVKEKLDGYEGGEMRSVQGQVQQLIQDATDTDRLCQMFPGWGAWL
uniref:Serine/threonine-protein kinase ATM n=1 Tax=Elaeis guineensis var. tenera TaxID=51953 RepID=A0A8N4F9K2_ELAGV|nr:serine/threonine-protein kinase ATM isoform X3 [Elaeis guineensis]